MGGTRRDERPIHSHTREDETLYGLACSITAFVGDQPIDVEAGSCAALPKNLPHGRTVKGGAAPILIILEPTGFEHFLVPRDESDSDPAKFGLEIIGPAPE